MCDRLPIALGVIQRQQRIGHKRLAFLRRKTVLATTQ